MRVASAASPSMMGTMGCSPCGMVKPSEVISSRKKRVFFSSVSRRRELSLRSSRTFNVAPAMLGHSVLENK